MTDSPKRRGAPRPTVVNVPSITEMKFKPLIDFKNKVNRNSPEARAHPLVVAADLARGSLKTLPGYIAKHQGIPDPDVALMLLKMIAGNVEQSSFRLVVIRHPDLKPNAKGNRRKDGIARPRQKDYNIAAWYEELRADYRKGEAIMNYMLTVTPSQSARKKAIGKLSPTVIKEAIRRVRHEATTALKLQQKIEKTLARREAALAQMVDEAEAKRLVPDVIERPVSDT